MTFFSSIPFKIVLMPSPVDKDEKEDLIILGERIKSIRTQKGLSLEQVAQRVSKDRQSVHKLEKGNFNPSYLYLKKICTGLEITLTQLFEDKA